MPGAAYAGLKSKACAQADLESDWTAHWCAELRVPVVFHRKIWELAYVLQGLFEADALRPGRKGVGFGCGAEPIASYLTSVGVQVTITDLAPDDERARGWWSPTRQSADDLRRTHHPALVPWETFAERASLEYVDMNHIPEHLTDYDFCWSVCAMEHLGSLENGLRFVENAMRVLKPGGVAVHTTEFNYANNETTIDNWPTVLYQRKHFEALAARLEASGHDVAPLDFDTGSKPLDRFIDMPPYDYDLPADVRSSVHAEPRHLKLMIDGYPCTCFGLIVRRASSAAGQRP